MSCPGCNACQVLGLAATVLVEIAETVNSGDCINCEGGLSPDCSMSATETSGPTTVFLCFLCCSPNFPFFGLRCSFIFCNFGDSGELTVAVEPVTAEVPAIDAEAVTVKALASDAVTGTCNAKTAVQAGLAD